MKPLILLILNVLLTHVDTVLYPQTDEYNYQVQSLHIFVVDRRITDADINKCLHRLLTVLDINKFGSKFIILDGIDGSIILSETSTLTRWQPRYRSTGNQDLNFTVIQQIIMNYTKSNAVIQGPVNFFMITGEAQFDNKIMTKLRDSNEIGEVIVITPNAEDPIRQIYNITNTELYLNAIRSTVIKEPYRIHPRRVTSNFLLNTTIDRNAVYPMVIDLEGAQPSSLTNEYKLLINGTRAAPLYLCKDPKMEECFDDYNNSFAISLNNIATLYLFSNTTNENYDCIEDDCRFIDSNRFILEIIAIPLIPTSNSNLYIWIGLVVLFALVLVVAFICVLYKKMRSNNEVNRKMNFENTQIMSYSYKNINENTNHETLLLNVNESEKVLK